MSETATSAMHVIKKEDKHAILSAFIAQDLEARGKDPATAGSSLSFCVIARSPNSPVARAVAELSDELAALGISVYAVFASLGSNGTPAKSQAADTEVNNTRVIQDTRLLDMHEVLLINDSSAWIGDCMRRDPAQSDAYERYSNNCAFTTASARSSFDQLWKGARAVKSAWISQPNKEAQPVIAEQDFMATSAVLSPLEDNSLRVPATRH